MHLLPSGGTRCGLPGRKALCWCCDAGAVMGTTQLTLGCWLEHCSCLELAGVVRGGACGRNGSVRGKVSAGFNCNRGQAYEQLPLRQAV